MTYTTGIPWFWIDEPPPEKDLELGIGKDVAWQSPLHREAVKRGDGAAVNSLRSP
jgi:hypothetical protein